MDSSRLLLRRALGQAGYTLMETLVVMTILLVVIGAIADGFTNASKTETDQAGRASDQESARQALERLRKDIHCASAANVGTNSSGGYTLNLTVNPGQCVAVTAGTGSGNQLSDGVQWCTVPINGATNRYGLYRTIARVLGKRRTLLHIPFGVARAGAVATQWLPGAPLSADQVSMLQGADNVVSNTDAADTFRLPLVPLEEQIRRAA